MKLGSWFMLTCFQTSVISSSMFLTVMDANPLAANLTLNTINRPIGWMDWAKAAVVPGLVSLVVVPLLLYLIYPPTIKSSPDAPKLAPERLEKMGPMSKNEMIMAVTLVLTVGLWIFRGVLNVDAVTAVVLGLAVLLITGVVTWKECLAKSVAWDILTWFVALIAMAGSLNKYGLITWFSQTVVKFVGGLGLSWQLSFGILILLHFYSHYFFASGAAHISAMFMAFLSVASALGTQHTLVHWFSHSSSILWEGPHITKLDQRQCSMVLDTCHSHNGGVIVSSSQLLIFTSSLRSEASSGRPSACGRVVIFPNS